MAQHALATTTATVPAPRSGFRSPQFWVGFAAIIGTYLLGQFGLNFDLGRVATFLGSLPNWLIPGVLLTGLVALLIAFTSYLETRGVKKNGPTKPGKPAPAGGKPFWSTSEFWLGLVTVALNYLHDTGVFAPDVRSSTSTTTLVIALAYTFARSQLKNAYANAVAGGN